MSDRPRPDDHLVEPLFAALHHDEQSVPTRRRRDRRLWVMLLALAGLAAIWFFTVGA
ncbi:MAG: hypothetical protein H6831_01945 [Planctomycetes bacterium]|nr:hypothetical protein [Planctomycetota bacterium]MCB9903148.1 hypothetical protein [Planctomycetota bacterium]